MIFAILSASLFQGPAEPQFSRCDGACEPTKTGWEVVLAAGDTARLEWSGQRFHVGPKAGVKLEGSSFVLAPQATGSWVHQLNAPSGRQRTELKLTCIPRQHVEITIHATGSAPRFLPWSLPAVAAELDRVFAPAGIGFSLSQGASLFVPRGEWDRNHNGRLDLWRNPTKELPDPEAESFDQSLQKRGFDFPRVVVMQDPVRIGWGTAEATTRGDSLLRLVGGDALPWREKNGTALRYLLEGPLGERSDTFFVEGYPPGGRVRIRTRGGGWGYDHPTTDFVSRPDQPAPAFGYVSRAREAAPPVLLIPRDQKDPILQARVLAHEIGHALGLEDEASPENLMSAVLHPEQASPHLFCTQILAMSRFLEQSPFTNKSAP